MQQEKVGFTGEIWGCCFWPKLRMSDITRQSWKSWWDTNPCCSTACLKHQLASGWNYWWNLCSNAQGLWHQWEQFGVTGKIWVLAKAQGVPCQPEVGVTGKIQVLVKAQGVACQQEVGVTGKIQVLVKAQGVACQQEVGVTGKIQVLVKAQGVACQQEVGVTGKIQVLVKAQGVACQQGVGVMVSCECKPKHRVYDINKEFRVTGKIGSLSLTEAHGVWCQQEAVWLKSLVIFESFLGPSSGA